MNAVAAVATQIATGADAAAKLVLSAQQGDYWLSKARFTAITTGQSAKVISEASTSATDGLFFRANSLVPVGESVALANLAAWNTLVAVPAKLAAGEHGGSSNIDLLNGKSWGWCRKTGFALIKECRVQIGGQAIDEHYGEWMDVWSQLSMPAEKANGHATMINEGATDYALQAKADEELTLYIPLQFWFCTNPGLSLPLIALQYHEVKIDFDFRQKKELIHVKHTEIDDEDWSTMGNGVKASLIDDNSVPSGELSADLMVEYIYLDTEERKRFAMMTHEYLITQLQHTGTEGWSNNRIRLNFNHPVKELIWVAHQNKASADFNEYFKYESMKTDRSLIKDAKLQLNGHDRFNERDSSYFTLVQPFQHHTNVPMDAIHVYSFALKPEDIQPSGTCNFSRIDNATLILNPTPEAKEYNETDANGGSTMFIYATNYNVLRIMSGMGGLAYAN